MVLVVQLLLQQDRLISAVDPRTLVLEVQQDLHLDRVVTVVALVSVAVVVVLVDLAIEMLEDQNIVPSIFLATVQGIILRSLVEETVTSLIILMEYQTVFLVASTQVVSRILGGKLKILKVPVD
jgi:hypothetical protein